MSKRVILLVLDGFGIGAMPDAASFREADAGAFTLKSLVQECSPLQIPNLMELGLGNTALGSGLRPAESPAGAFGRALLAHWGADTYAGHNEMQGARPLKPAAVLFREVAEEMRQALERAGYQMATAVPEGSALLVDGEVLVADNLESDPGRIYNVTGPLDTVPFEKIVAIGQLVRGIAKTSRVIALGGTDITVADILRHTITNAVGQTGVVTPELHIYNDTYKVRHLGYGIRPEAQAPSLVAGAGLPVALVGKMADVIECSAATKIPCVQTEETMNNLLRVVDRMEEGYISCTVQETDLAGHEEDARKYASVLAMADRGIGELRRRLKSGDILIITADHGNDPLIGHRFHTREQVPLLVAGPGVRPGNFGVRATMADVAATACDHLGARAPEAGESFLRLVI